MAKGNNNNRAGKGTDKKVEGAQQSSVKAGMPVMPTTNAGTANRVSPAAVTGAAPKLDLKRLPKIAGFSMGKGGKRGSSGVKRLLYALFAIPYADWTKFGRFVANRQMTTLFVDGAEHTTENRIWGVINTKTGEEVARISQADKADYKLPENCGLTPYTMPNEEIEGTGFASFVKNADLADHFTKLAAELEKTNPEQSATYKEYAEAYGKGNKYGGFACATAENIPAVVAAIREYFALNPEAESPFTEMEIYQPIFMQDGLEPIVNEQWAETAEGKAEAEAAAAETTEATGDEAAKLAAESTK